MRHVSSVLAAAIGIVGLSASALGELPTEPGFQGIWYEITGNAGTYPNKYGGGLATYPQQSAPIAIYSAAANKTFFTYGGRDPNGGDLQHMMSYYDHATKKVARPRVWMDTSENTSYTTDAHDSPVIAMDAQGYIYQFSNVHGENRRSFIRRSAEPYSIDSHVGLLSTTDSADTAVFGNPIRFSYASAWYVPQHESFLLSFTRYSPNVVRDLYWSTSADGDTWTARQSFADMASGQYQTSWIKPDGKTVGTIFDVHPSSGPTGTGNDARTNLYYLETDDMGRTWRTAGGEAVATPVTNLANLAMVMEYQSKGLNVYFKDVNYDAGGRPVILYETSKGAQPGPGNGPREIRIARFDGTAWQDSLVTQSDHNYDHGSLYIEGDTWRIIGPFIDGPQAWGTGGEVGVWQSGDLGQTWKLIDQLTSGSVYNHTYVRRPLNASDDFYAFWASGDAFESSIVELHFSDKAGNVYKLPYNMEGEFADPILVRAVPEPAAMSVMLTGGLALLRRR